MKKQKQNFAITLFIIIILGHDKWVLTCLSVFGINPKGPIYGPVRV